MILTRRFLFIVLLFTLLINIFTGCTNTTKEWENAEKINTIEAYDAFLKKHPSSEFTDKANKKTEDIKWQKTKEQNTVESFEKYLKEYPKGLYSALAKQQVENIKWQEAQESNTVESFLHYLNYYPAGLYAKEAKKELRLLPITPHIPPCLEYQGSVIFISYDLNVKLVELKYNDGSWSIIKDTIGDKLDYTKASIVGMIKKGSTVDPQSIKGAKCLNNVIMTAVIKGDSFNMEKVNNPDYYIIEENDAKFAFPMYKAKGSSGFPVVRVHLER